MGIRDLVALAWMGILRLFMGDEWFGKALEKRRERAGKRPSG